MILLKSKKSANYDKTNSKYDDSFKNVSRFTINKANKNNNVNADNNEDINTILRNHLNNISMNDYNNFKYEKKLSDIEKMKDSLSNELSKKRRRYQSIILPNNKDILDFTQKNKDKDKNSNQNKGALKTINNGGNANTIDKGKINRMSIHDIIKK